MPIYLVQHGRSYSKAEDPNQGITPEGIADVERIAAVAKGYKVPVSRIFHSVKPRAKQTAELFAATLEPSGGLREAKGLSPLDDVAAFAATLRADSDLMVVGHLPFMDRLCGLLVTGSSERSVFRFQNGGILCLDREQGDPNWVIHWGLMPRVGRACACCRRRSAIPLGRVWGC